MLRGVSLVKTFGSRSSASLFSVTSRDHRLEVATFHLHPRNEAAEPATCNEFATTAAKGAYSGWPKGPKSRSSAAPMRRPTTTSVHRSLRALPNEVPGHPNKCARYRGGGSMPNFRLAVTAATCLTLPLALAACSLVPSGAHADLAPTLTFQDEPGGPVAFQSGQPVPTFDRQPRLRADLDGTWRFDAEPLATNLTMSDRGRALKEITAEMGKRADLNYDDSQWPALDVPGTFNMPGNRSTSSGYYRLDFLAPTTW